MRCDFATNRTCYEHVALFSSRGVAKRLPLSQPARNCVLRRARLTLDGAVVHSETGRYRTRKRGFAANGRLLGRATGAGHESHEKRSKRGQNRTKNTIKRGLPFWADLMFSITYEIRMSCFPGPSGAVTDRKSTRSELQ